jgi:RNA polymerase sigma-70 factor (ECF subfamily)
MSALMVDSPGVKEPQQGIARPGAHVDWPIERDAILRQLVELHFDFIWRLLRRLGVSPGDVDDATQQVFIVASSKLEALDLQRARQFLFGVALRVAANARRLMVRRREVDSHSLLELEHGSPSPEDAVERRKGLEALDRILQVMPDELRIVLILTEIEEMPKSEVATLLRIPPGTVASRLKRARETFRASLARSELVQSQKAGRP